VQCVVPTGLRPRSTFRHVEKGARRDFEIISAPFTPVALVLEVGIRILPYIDGKESSNDTL